MNNRNRNAFIRLRTILRESMIAGSIGLVSGIVIALLLDLPALVALLTIITCVTVGIFYVLEWRNG